MKIANVSLIAASLLLANATDALGAPRDPYDLIQSADADGNGRVSREELKAARGTIFARLDRNRDGKLNAADRPLGRAIGTRMVAAEIEALAAHFDSNMDGAVSNDEFVNGPTPVFDGADTNNDGFVDAAEVAAKRAEARR